MAITTIGQHQAGVFNAPVNRTDKTVDANQVRGNDNALVRTVNAHDADGSMHVLGDATTFAVQFLLMGA